MLQSPPRSRPGPPRYSLSRVSEVPYTGLSSQLSKFLQHMQQEQIVQVKELSKGVESIVAVDWRHPR